MQCVAQRSALCVGNSQVADPNAVIGQDRVQGVPGVLRFILALAVVAQIDHKNAVVSCDVCCQLSQMSAYPKFNFIIRVKCYSIPDCDLHLRFTNYGTKTFAICGFTTVRARDHHNATVINILASCLCECTDVIKTTYLQLRLVWSRVWLFLYRFIVRSVGLTFLSVDSAKSRNGKHDMS